MPGKRYPTTADDMIALRRGLIAGALSPDDLVTLNSLLQRVLTGIEEGLGPRPPRETGDLAGQAGD
jgi:hypothetical protein